MLGADVPGHRQKQLTPTLIVRLSKANLIQKLEWVGSLSDLPSSNYISCNWPHLLSRRSKSRSPSQKKSESVSSSKTRSRSKRASPPATDRRNRSADSVSSGDSSKLVIAYSDSPESNDDISDGEFTRWRKKIREQERLSGTKKRRSSTGNPTNAPSGNVIPGASV